MSLREDDNWVLSIWGMKGSGDGWELSTVINGKAARSACSKWEAFLCGDVISQLISLVTVTTQ